MAKIGQINSLQVVKEVDFGVYLDGGDRVEILLPKRYVPAATKVRDYVNVFIYRDSEDRLIATTDKPLAVLDDILTTGSTASAVATSLLKAGAVAVTVWAVARSVGVRS